MSTGSIRVDRGTSGRIGIVLDRAGKANALTAAMMAELAEAVRSASASDTIVLSSASPRLFSAGADIGEFLGGGLPAQEHALLAMIAAMAKSDAPIIAVSYGRASGAGAILLCLADVVIAADDLEIAAPEFVFGMYPIIVEAVLRSRLSPAVATRMCLGAGVLTAAGAVDAGIATELLPRENFTATAVARVAYYVERSPGLAALRRSRKMSAATAELADQLAKAAPLMLENFAEPSVRERIERYLANLKLRA